MSGPPEDIPAVELWDRIVQTDAVDVRPFELVDYPRNDLTTGQPIGKLAIWPLKWSEIVAAKAEATKTARAYIKEKFDATEKIEGYAQVFEDLCASEMIYRYARKANNRAIAAFPTAALVRAHLTGDEMAVLSRAYAFVQVRLGPIITLMTSAEQDAWVARLAEGGSTLPLRLLSWEQQIALLMYSASQLHSLRTGRSLAGLAQEKPIKTEDDSETPSAE